MKSNTGYRRAVTPFGKELQRIRLERGILKSTMAKNLGVTSAKIDAYETGLKAMSYPMLKKLISKYSLPFERQIDILHAYKISEDQEDIYKETTVVRVQTEVVDNAILKLLNVMRGLDPSEFMTFIKAIEELICGKLESKVFRLGMFDVRLPKRVYNILKDEYGFVQTVNANLAERKRKYG